MTQNDIFVKFSWNVPYVHKADWNLNVQLWCLYHSFDLKVSKFVNCAGVCKLCTVFRIRH